MDQKHHNQGGAWTNISNGTSQFFQNNNYGPPGRSG